jgi:Ca-activated chloride channel family protein
MLPSSGTGARRGSRGSASIQSFSAGYAGLAGAQNSARLSRPIAGDLPLIGQLYYIAVAPVTPAASPNSESYEATPENEFLSTSAHPLSTFSIDVDTASYSNVRRFLNADQLPPPDAVRIEELINNFPYSDPQPEGDQPFSINLETARTPWAPDHELLRIGIQGRQLDKENRPPSNLVFLVDVSGSMRPKNKLPLLKRSLRSPVPFA